MVKQLTSQTQSDRAVGDYVFLSGVYLFLRNLENNVWVPGDAPNGVDSAETTTILTESGVFDGNDSDIANTTFQTGLDIVNAEYLVFSFTDANADRHDWPSAWIDVTKYPDQGNEYTYVWNHDNGYLQIFVENIETGQIRIVDQVRNARLKRISTWKTTQMREVVRETLVDPDLVSPTPAPDPFIYSWGSFGGSAMSTPPAFTPERDMIVRATWTAQGYKTSTGFIGWNGQISDATLIGEPARLRVHINANNLSEHIPLGSATAFYRVEKDKKYTPGYSAALTGTQSDQNDYFSIVIEEVTVPIQTISSVAPGSVVEAPQSQIDPLESSTPLQTPASIIIPYSSFIDTITLNLGEAITELNNTSVVFSSTAFSGLGNAQSSVGGWTLDDQGVWNQLTRTITGPGGVTYQWRILYRSQAGNLILYIHETYSSTGEINRYGQVKSYRVTYKPYPDLVVALPPSLPVVHVYGFTLGSAENDANNLTISDWTEMTGKGYTVGAINLICDHSGSGSWLNPGNYIGSNDAQWQVRYTLSPEGSLSTWQKGASARGKNARLSITWVKSDQIN